MPVNLGTASASVTLDISQFVANANVVTNTMNQMASAGGQGTPSFLSNMNKAALGIGTALIAPMTLGLKAAVDLEQGLANVDAALGDISDADLSMLGDQFNDIAIASQYSAVQVAAVAEELAKAGFGVDELEGATQATVDLAQATGTQLPSAVGAVTQAMAVWQEGIVDSTIALTDATRVADVYTVVANNTSASVEGLSIGLRSLGPVAASLGISFNEAAAAVGLFTNFGLPAADAGLSLTRAMTDLADPTSAASQQLEELGITAFDTQGNFVGFSSLFDQLNTSMAGMSDQAKITALSAIFGAEAIDVMGLAVLTGADAYDELLAKTFEYGAAAESSAIRMDTLSAQFGTLVEGVNTFLGSLVSGLIPGLRIIVDALNGFIDVLSNIPAPIKTVIGAVAGLLAGFAAITRSIQTFRALNGLMDAFAGNSGAATVASRGLGSILLRFVPILGLVSAGFLIWKANLFDVQGRFRTFLTGFKRFANSLKSSYEALTKDIESFNIWGGRTGIAQQGMAMVPAFLIAFGNAIAGIGGGLPVLESFGKGLITVGTNLVHLTEAFDHFRSLGLDPVQAGLRALGIMFPEISGFVGDLQIVVGQLTEAFHDFAAGDFSNAFAGLGAAAQTALDALGDAFYSGLQVAWGAIRQIPWETIIPPPAWNAILVALDWGTFIIDLLWGDYVDELDWNNYLEGDGTIDWSLYIGLLTWETYLAVLTWSDYIAPLTWDTYLTALVWADYLGLFTWETYLTALTWLDYVSVLEWETYLAVLTWSDYIAPLTWDTYITALTWLDYLAVLEWNTYLTALTWSEYVAQLEWNTYLAVLTWSDFVAPFQWDAYLAVLTWTDYIAAFEWDAYLTAITWSDYIGKLTWGTYLTALTWGDYVGSFTWDAYINALDWVDWVGKLTWDVFVGDLNWGDFIPPLSFPSSGEILDAIIDVFRGNATGTTPLIPGTFDPTTIPGAQQPGTGLFPLTPQTKPGDDIPVPPPVSDATISSWRDYGSAISDATAAAGAAKDAISGLSGEITASTASLMLVGLQIGSDLVNSISNGIALTAGTITTNLTSALTTAIGNASLGMLAAGLQIGQQVVSGISLGILAESGQVSAAIANLIVVMISMGPAFRGAGVLVGLAGAGGIGQGLGNGSGFVTAGLARLIAVIIGMSGAFRGAGILDGLSTSQGIATGIGSGSGAISGALARIVGIVLGYAGAMRGAGVAIGIGLGQGIAAGIQSQIGAIAAAAAAAVSAAVGAARAAGGISSPSKVMADQVGEPLSQGVAMGIIAGLPVIYQAGERMVPPITGNFRTAGSSMASGGSVQNVQINQYFPDVEDPEVAAQRAGERVMQALTHLNVEVTR